MSFRAILANAVESPILVNRALEATAMKHRVFQAFAATLLITFVGARDLR